MEELSRAIDRFVTAADRLERAGARAARRAEGAAAQGAIIAQLRAELSALRGGGAAAVEAPQPATEEGTDFAARAAG